MGEYGKLNTIALIWYSQVRHARMTCYVVVHRTHLRVVKAYVAYTFKPFVCKAFNIRYTLEFSVRNTCSNTEQWDRRGKHFQPAFAAGSDSGGGLDSCCDEQIGHIRQRGKRTYES